MKVRVYSKEVINSPLTTTKIIREFTNMGFSDTKRVIDNLRYYELSEEQIKMLEEINVTPKNIEETYYDFEVTHDPEGFKDAMTELGFECKTESELRKDKLKDLGL